MRRRILTFLLVPVLGGFFATILYLMQAGFGGELDLFIGFFELPGSLLIFPMGDVQSFPGPFVQIDFLIGIAIPSLLNVGLFFVAGFVSWKLFPPPRSDSSAERLSHHLNRTGWSIQDSGVSSGWIVTATRNQMVIRVEERSRAEAIRHAYEQAVAADVRTNAWLPSTANVLFALVCIVVGHLFEAFFGWLLLLGYGFASMNPPALNWIQQLRMTLAKMLDPRDGLWGTLFFLVGIIGGMSLIFTGCFRLSPAVGPSAED